jgi:hypothetical protein
MNQLERVFLSAVQFDLIVHDDEFQLYHNEIRRHMSEGTFPNMAVGIPCSFFSHLAASCPKKFKAASDEYDPFHVILWASTGPALHGRLFGFLRSTNSVSLSV